MPISNETDINIVNRSQIKIKGVNDIISYDSEKIIFSMDEADLVLIGDNFNIQKLDVTNGNAEVTGTLFSMSFTNGKSKSGRSFLASLFK